MGRTSVLLGDGSAERAGFPRVGGGGGHITTAAAFGGRDALRYTPLRRMQGVLFFMRPQAAAEGADYSDRNARTASAIDSRSMTFVKRSGFERSSPSCGGTGSPVFSASASIQA